MLENILKSKNLGLFLKFKEHIVHFTADIIGIVSKKFDYFVINFVLFYAKPSMIQ